MVWEGGLEGGRRIMERRPDGADGIEVWMEGGRKVWVEGRVWRAMGRYGWWMGRGRGLGLVSGGKVGGGMGSEGGGRE